MTVEAARRYETFLQTLVDNVNVENGPFDLETKQRLHVVLQVSVIYITKSIAAASAGIFGLMRGEAERTEMTKEQHALFLAAAARGGDFIRLEGNRVIVSWPMTRADYDKE